MTAIKHLPATIIDALSIRFKCKAPLHYFKALAWMNGTNNSSFIANRFANPVVNGQIQQECSIADYIRQLYASPHGLPQSLHPLQTQDPTTLSSAEV